MITRERILHSLEPVLAQPHFVTIDTQKVAEVAESFLDVQLPPWDNELQLLGTPAETAQYYFFLDSINFCFWSAKGKPRWEYMIDGEWVGGYYAYSRAIKDAFLSNPRFFDAEYLSTLSEKDFRAIFALGRNELLLMDERLCIIRKNFQILQKMFEGQALNLLNAATHDADMLVLLLLNYFPSFNDCVVLDDRRIVFLKRAQIFVSDVSFTGLPELAIGNLDHLTVFADYKLPQILEALGVLVYAPRLNENIRDEVYIPKGSRQEIELRASSIAAIEYIRTEMEKRGRTIHTNQLDWILWVKAKETSFPKPHHKTLTTFY